LDFKHETTSRWLTIIKTFKTLCDCKSTPVINVSPTILNFNTYFLHFLYYLYVLILFIYICTHRGPNSPTRSVIIIGNKTIIINNNTLLGPDNSVVKFVSAAYATSHCPRTIIVATVILANSHTSSQCTLRAISTACTSKAKLGVAIN